MCLGYWKNPETTKAQYVGDWWVTVDLAKKDEDGGAVKEQTGGHRIGRADSPGKEIIVPERA